jgi:hypothetical protein
VVECIRLESEQTVKGLGSSNLPLSSSRVAKSLRQAALTGAIASASLALTGSGAQADLYGTLSGKIVDARSGAAILGAAIGVADPGDAARYALPVASSRRDGSFSIVGIRESDVVVEVQVRGYAPAVCRYRLSPGGETRLTFRLAPSVRGMPAREACPTAPAGGGQTQDVYVIR